MESTASFKNLPALDTIVIGLAGDTEKIMISLYDLQKSLPPSSSQLFSSVRKELRIQWEGLRSYLQRCYGFGEDVLALKTVLAKSTADFIEFLTDMKASADELRDFSPDLKMKDMSEAFSKGIGQRNSGNTSNSPFIKEIKNSNLKTFVVAIGRVNEHKHLIEIDAALTRISSNFKKMCEFWDATYSGCVSLIKQSEISVAPIPPEDVEQIISNWKRYQDATSKSIVSITRTDNAILVEAHSEDKRQRFALGWLVDAIAKWLRG